MADTYEYLVAHSGVRRECYLFGDPIPVNTLGIQPEDMGRLRIDVRKRWETSVIEK